MTNTGRDIYENTLNYFRLMLKIEGGEVIVQQMIDQYKVQYKNRRAMLEIFAGFSLSK